MDERDEPGQQRQLREAVAPYDANYVPPARRRERRMAMSKTSVYLEPADTVRLEWLSSVEGRPQAEVIRDAIREYRPRTSGRVFASFGSVRGDGTSIADLADEELLDGFGEDSWT